LGALLGGLGMASGRNKIAVRGINVIHKPLKCLNVCYINLSPTFRCINDNASRVVSVMARVDQHIDLPASPAKSAFDARVWRDTKVRRKLVGN
jgi:hypothetical protein